jgi:hypothetical protein
VHDVRRQVSLGNVNEESPDIQVRYGR